MKRYWLLTKKVFSEWNRHEAQRMGAALAFYTILSLSPLLVLGVAIAGLFFDRSGVSRQVTAQLQDLIGPTGAQAVSATLESAQKSSGQGITATALSLLVLFISASGVFVELRSALNKIWDVDPDSQSGIKGMLRERIFTFGMVLAVGFLLIASLILSAILAAASTFLGNVIAMPGLVAALIDLLISLVGVAAVFALMYRYVPATTVSWRQAWVGGGLTALLFTVGKYLLGIYLAKAAPGSAYGAAGSVVVLIIWVYYTAQIVFFGAEFTHVTGGALSAGSRVVNFAPTQSHRAPKTSDAC
jgi:membrane protein